MKDKEKYFLPYLYPHVAKLEKPILHNSVINLLIVNSNTDKIKQKNVDFLSRPYGVYDRERPIKFNQQSRRINLEKKSSIKINNHS